MTFNYWPLEELVCAAAKHFAKVVFQCSSSSLPLSDDFANLWDTSGPLLRKHGALLRDHAQELMNFGKALEREIQERVLSLSKKGEQKISIVESPVVH